MSPLPLGPRTVQPALLAFSVLLLAACDREERDFHVEPPHIQRASRVRQVSLQPGSPSPDIQVENEYEENAYAVAEGKRPYNAFNCVGCHAHGGGDIGPPLMDGKWIYGGQPEQIYDTILEGRPNGMPSFQGKIPDHQVWQLVAYVRSMSGQLSRNVAPTRDDIMNVGLPENSRDPETTVPSFRPRSGEMPL